jgi:hypothetical protein
MCRPLPTGWLHRVVMFPYDRNKMQQTVKQCDSVIPNICSVFTKETDRMNLCHQFSFRDRHLLHLSSGSSCLFWVSDFEHPTLMSLFMWVRVDPWKLCWQKWSVLTVKMSLKSICWESFANVMLYYTCSINVYINNISWARWMYSLRNIQVSK